MKRIAVLAAIVGVSLFAADDDPLSARGPLRLSLKRAVEIATSPEGNTRIQLAQEQVRQAKARSAQLRSALLPTIDSFVGAQDLTRSLAAQGLNEIDLPFGIVLPERVGPFTVMDARVTGYSNLLDFSAIRRLQAGHAGIRTAQTESSSTQDQVSVQVAKAYLAALRADAELEAVEANIRLAEAVLKLAQHQKEAGTGTGIEITRARVQLSYEKQRLLAAQNERRKADLQLLHAMNMNLDTQVELTDKLRYMPVDATMVDGATKEALQSRLDLKAQNQRENAARLMSSAVRYEHLPALVGGMDYGTTGSLGNPILPTRTYQLGLRVPVFDGGRREARRAESESQYRSERIRTNELREQIQMEVRIALDSLHSAEDQVQVAEEGLQLAESELTQARRRYEAGVTSSLEVTDAQTRLERAQDNRITALFNYNVARIDLGHATGDTRRMIQ